MQSLHLLLDAEKPVGAQAGQGRAQRRQRHRDKRARNGREKRFQRVALTPADRVFERSERPCFTGFGAAPRQPTPNPAAWGERG
jgi:hypothetical protein